MTHTCPSCGFPGLREPPRAKNGGGSYEICPSCGFQFGVSDDDAGFTYESWRARWKAAGSPWTSQGMSPPPGWNATAQLAAFLDPDEKSARGKKARVAGARKVK